MGSQSRQHLAMDAQTRQAEALERIAVALERLAAQHAPLINPDALEDLLADVPPEGWTDGE